MKTAVIVFPGSNCDHDMYHAFRHILGREVDFVWHREESLEGYDLVTLPGGFSYGDYLRAGAIARTSPIMKQVARHVERGGYALGVCNGFQILTEAGLLPGALLQNRKMKFLCQPVTLKVITNDAFVTSATSRGDLLTIPIAHMEGLYLADDQTLDTLEAEDRVLFRYVDRGGAVTDEANPNGSIRNIAGILSENRRVAGMMPHPERAVEQEVGGEDGLKIFASALTAFA